MKRIVLSMIMIMALCSCEHREINLYTDTEVVFDWKNLVQSDAKSATMDVYYYNNETGEYLVVNGNESGAKQFIPYSSYQLLAFSSGVKNVDYKGLDSYSTAGAYAQMSSSGVLLQPGSVYVAQKDVVLKPSDKTIHLLRLDPYIKKIILKMDLTGETARVAGCRFTLSGIATGVNFSTGKVIYSSANTYSIESPTVTSQPLQTTLSFFGRDETKNIMTIDITLTDSTVTTLKVDITEALENINNTNIPGIELEPEVKIEKDSTTGFKAKLTGWKVGTGSGTVVSKE